MCPAASAKEHMDARSKACVSTVSLWTFQRTTATELTLGNVKTHFSHLQRLLLSSIEQMEMKI